MCSTYCTRTFPAEEQNGLLCIKKRHFDWLKLFHVCLVLHSCKKYLTKAKVWGNSFAGFGFSSLPSVCENKISLDWFASLNNGLNLFYQGSLQHLEMTHPACNMYQLKPNSVLQPRMYISNEINYVFFLLTTKKQFIKKKKLITSHI